MAKKRIVLGTTDQVQAAFSVPNILDKPESLEATVTHWLSQTLTRDGFDPAALKVVLDAGNCVVELNGLPTEASKAYSDRLTNLMACAAQALATINDQIATRRIWCPGDKILELWDPQQTKDWRMFMTLGVGLVNHRSLQFFHYPPSRLLNPLRDSMQDPVTYRCRDLLLANGVKPDETKYYETRINSTPIAAPDDQGTNPSPDADPLTGGFVPISYFRSFDIAMIKNLIKPHPTKSGYTIPMTIYGRDPMLQFGGLFLGPDKAMIIEIQSGLKTPVLGSNHPYRFYGTAQTKPNPAPGQVIGSGKMLPGAKVAKACLAIQQDDLAVVRWQVRMAEDPSRDPFDTIREAQAFWKADKNQELVKRLIKRHASLIYDDYSPTSTTVSAGLKFGFRYDYDGKRQNPFG